MATTKKPATPVKTPAKGALAKDPEFVLGTDANRLNEQLARWQKRLKVGDKDAKGRIAEIQRALSALPQDPAASTPAESPGPGSTEQYNSIIDKAGDSQTKLIDQTIDQGPFDPTKMGVAPIKQFQPGDFQQQFQGAYDTAINQFNRSSEPAFQKQKQDFDQFVAERGIDPTSEQYRQLYKARISDPQETARLNAQDAAYQTGMGAQNQAYSQASGTYGQNLGAQGQQYGQASGTYQMPYQNLSALSPYLQAQYGQQSAQQQQGYTQDNMAQSQDYAKELAALQQKYQMQNQKFAAAHQGGGGGGGGYQGMSLADQMALQNNQFYNNMVLGGLQGGQQAPNNPYNSALQGAASGLGTGIAMGLMK